MSALRSILAGLLPALLTAGLALVAAPTARAQVALRPIDRATVRIIALARAYPTGESPRYDFAASHGSGVLVADGWIATAGHVVDDAAILIVIPPGGERGMPAVVARRLPERDLAILRVSGELDSPIALPDRPPALTLGDPISASGYPLDMREMSPAAVSGQIGRPLNDGRVQLSMSVNPGNSGGPVITARGALVGIISQGANPQAGAQGLAIMEPIDALSAPLREARAAGGEAPPSGRPAIDMLLERLSGHTTLELDARVGRLQQARPEGPIESAAFAIEADAVAAALLARAGAVDVAGADPVTRGLVNGLRESADAWGAQVGGSAPATRVEPTPAAPPAAPASASPAGSAAPQITGPATGPSLVAPDSEVETETLPIAAIALQVGAGLMPEETPNAPAVNGGVGTLGALFRLRLGRGAYARVAFVVGADLALGGFRERLVFAGVARLGLELELGPPMLHGFVSVEYTPGFSVAEEHTHGTGVAYRGAAGVGFGDWSVGVAWQEMARAADDPYRAATLFAEWELGL